MNPVLFKGGFHLFKAAAIVNAYGHCSHTTKRIIQYLTECRADDTNKNYLLYLIEKEIIKNKYDKKIM